MPLPVPPPATTSADPIDLAVVVVNFRTPDLTEQCLHSLVGEVGSLAGMQVIVVDNGSGDGSAERLAGCIERQRWSDWVTLERSAGNLGFAGGCNLGLSVAPPARYVLLLNSDARVEPGCLSACVARMDRAGTVGALSCKLLQPDGRVQNVVRRFPTPARLIAEAFGLPTRWPRLFGWADLEDPGWDRSTEARDVDWIGGAFLVLRFDVLRRVGPLDDDFFFMGEDVELCHRIWRAGFRCHYDPAVSVTHDGAGSTRPSEQGDAWRRRQLFRARYIYLRKCHGQLAAVLVRCVDLAAWGLRAAWRRLAYPSGHRNRLEAVATWRLLAGRLDAR